jgi:hypoxanthine phosphoribosyltransferase
MTAHKDLEIISYSEETIRRRVAEMGRELAAEYADKKPVFIGILKGAFVFLADLVRACEFPLEPQFLKASSYGMAAVTSGKVDIADALDVDIAGRHVLIVEDIIDTGVTMSRLRELLLAKNPASLKFCAFLDKAERRIADISVDYAGYVTPDAFFVGYGLDYAERYRNLPYIGVLKPELYSD